MQLMEVSRSIKQDLWREVSFRKKGIKSHETLTPGSKVHFLQNYHGSFFHGEVKTSLP